MEQTEKIEDRIVGHLSRLIGPNNARIAVKTFAAKAVGGGAQELRREQVPQVLEAMLPMLRTLLGKEAAAKLLEDIKGEFRS